jgi:HEAT repeat protein
MPSSNEVDLPALTAELRNKASPKRRSAAKRLRKLGLPAACPALLEALEVELGDERTWETQYQMIMALGASGCKEALPTLKKLSLRRMEATMVLVAVGDALVRLGREFENDPRPVFDVFNIDNDSLLVDGALRAVAMLRLHFEPDIVERLVHQVIDLKDQARYFWLAAACPGWSGDSVNRFLQMCVNSSNAGLKTAAEAAQVGKYLNWNPL